MSDFSDQLLTKLPEGAVPLFLTFTRFEFALKRCDYLRNLPDAYADWHKLDCELGEAFFISIRKSGKTDMLIVHPPKKQVCVSGKLNWKAMPPVDNVRELFEAVRRVRNNLAFQYHRAWSNQVRQGQN